MAQPVSFFMDSPNARYYDTGLAFQSGSSSIARTGPTQDKLPVQREVQALQGSNSLRLSWTSQPGGNWRALVIAPGFPFQNITLADTLAFWAYAPEGLAQHAWPLISMEGAPGATVSRAYRLRGYAPALAPRTWVRVKLPLDLWFSDPQQTNIDFNQIKAIIFSQDSADAQPHTLYIDEVMAFGGNFQPAPPAAPAQWSAQGYDSHVELRWAALPPANLAGCLIWRSADGGATWQAVRKAAPADTLALDFVGPGGFADLRYRLAPVNAVGQPGPLTPEVQAATRVFSDEELLDMVQRYTFRYFWDFGHPVSGMARERNVSGDLVTSGGTGFGILGMLAGAERGYVTRAQALARLLQLVSFLETADRFQGAFPHWMNGITGDVIPFSQYDNGADLVETAFLMQGLLTARQYFSGSSPDEQLLRQKITALWEGVNWNFFRRGTRDFLYWHWSPNFAWQMNFPLRGYNEGLIVYLLAEASPTYSPPASIYQAGWAGSNYLNGNSYYGFRLDVGPARGGPLFFAHYSYLGFDPRNLRDAYTNYARHNRFHSLVNQAYCISNPEGHAGYSAECWGLTASDDPLVGYLAHEPTASGDNGTLSPTAALSSMPWTPWESMAALKHFYRVRGSGLFGPMGFYDAFNPSLGWVADSYLAIDQGPILAMIENYRSGLLWQHFMANPEIAPALAALGFTADSTGGGVGVEPDAGVLPLSVYPNPAGQAGAWAEWVLPQTGMAELTLLDPQGRLVWRYEGHFAAGTSGIRVPAPGASGLYLLRLHSAAGQTAHLIRFGD
ncbi:MAG: glucoamylase family protein [Bacteroidia bacterium]|nr:glucoamylase family protein [Bacteroidia bacterium]